MASRTEGDPGPFNRVGDGSTEIQIGAERGRVVMIFRKSVNWVAYDPQNAVDVAKCMIDSAVELGANVQIMLPKRQIKPQVYNTLVTRVGLVMKNQLEKKEHPQKVARQLVDIVLGAIE